MSVSLSAPSVVPAGTRVGRSVGVLSTFPPQLCGLATFAEALSNALEDRGTQVVRVALDDGRTRRPNADTCLVNGRPGEAERAAQVLSECDVAIIQHEYGIFGGVDGDEVLDVLTALAVPSIVVLHTVPLSPTPRQRQVLESICASATRVVVMAITASDRLATEYTVDPSKLTIVPHGATPPVSTDARTGARADPAGTLRLLTWGLLGPGKGIEHAISSLALLQDLRPRIRYTVAGATHPNVFARDGDRYRHELMRRSWALGVAGSVRFDDTYRDLPTLMRFVAASSVVVLPYDSHDQVTSGVLVDALAAGRPVIASAFPHAVEMLSDGAGMLVPHGDPGALAEAIRSLADDPDRLAEMSARAAALAPDLAWTAVADRYLRMCGELVPAAVRASA